ncbi:EF-hand domain-containing protein [Allosphingosinicella deserti]|uniref:EF-hand domain-containing protein n=1 Tax=Allosphingosinicella deserti TaxID=2116704 RepID=A0A2P7QJK8_9SPHN|nr:hypothetical protein [Sphingomonas deserti]PSJ38157.1 hypothetical protein C7I55_20715 [Sphingomonas deserti]
MNNKKKWLFGGGGLALLAAGASGFAVAPGPRGLAAADLDGNGQITAAEAASAAQQKFAEADANKDGRLTADELPRRGGRHHHRGHRDPPPGAGPQAQPQPGPTTQRPELDANGDGAVTASEFTDRLQQRFARADANHDGIVSAAELAAAKPQRGGHHRR